MKTCSICKEEKPESEFHTDKRNKDNLYSQCKQCRRERYNGESTFIPKPKPEKPPRPEKPKDTPESRRLDALVERTLKRMDERHQRMRKGIGEFD
ncbi:MAG: hypothetical protein ACTSVR_01350 [Candidatus Thorarchaeota archaeon]